ncbi:MAG: molybdopterin-synthase adenylyltransferase MoeB [Candidatus Neomarinimicrobiota bacterium]
MNGKPSKMDQPLQWYNRYARHIALDQVGEGGQQVLNAARVLVLGAGGLGSPVALYLSAAGVGTIGVVDHDDVSLNNLQRQIIHGTADIGRPKVESATDTMQDLNPDIRVIAHKMQVVPDNIWDLVADYDLVVDGSDNFVTRYLVNDVCHQAGKPLVFGAVLQFWGQVTTFTREPDCGCYRCLFPKAPDQEHTPSCLEAGIFGAVTGVIGSLQATEALKLILNRGGYDVGPVLKNRLLLYDGNESSFRQVALKPDPRCVVCSRPEFDFRRITYKENCAVKDRGAGMEEVGSKDV